MQQKFQSMIQIDIPRHNVEIHTLVSKIKFQPYKEEQENNIIIFMGSKFGFLNKRPDGWWYFTILIKPNMEYTYYTHDIVSGNREHKVSGHELARIIYDCIKWEKQNYN